MKGLLDRINQVRTNLATARRESQVVDELMALKIETSSPEVLRDLANRLRAMADAKDGDWFTHTFTPSTAAELRCLADSFEQVADEPLLWKDGQQ